MQLGVGFGPRILLSDMRPELCVLAECLTERLVIGQPGFTEGVQVERDESFALLVGDLQVAVHVDHVSEAQPAGEAIRPAEGLRREPGQVIDVGGRSLGEKGLEHLVGECLGVEQVLEPVQCFVAARVLVQRLSRFHYSEPSLTGCCRGLGDIDLDVQYLPDITVQCPTCHGARFNDATLAVRVDGLTIADVLDLSVDDALQQFAHRAPVIAALRPVSEVGLGYLRLGEPTPSLSGGESQRLRIATRLRSSQRGALYVFDEPSTGLHPLDVATLVGVFDRLLDAGATIIVIDHDLDLLAAADHLIDMGPGGGPDGGHIVAAGTPEDVARAPDSVTGSWLADHLGLQETRPASSSTSGAHGSHSRGTRHRRLGCHDVDRRVLKYDSRV